MKRLILRIAALGTVVVLGLIAIAQAQRGYDDPIGEATHDSAANSVSGSSGGLRGRTTTTPSGVNPLRSRADQATAGGVPSPSRLPLSNNTLLTATTDPTPTDQPMPRPALDPFARKAGYNELPAEETPAEETSADQMAATDTKIPDAAALDVPGSEPSEPASNSLQRITTASPSAFPAPAPAQAERDATDRMEVAQAGQPALLQANPTLNPNSVPHATVATDSRYTRSPAIAQGGPSPLGREAARALPLPSSQGTGQPGSKQLEGPQSPHLTIQKVVPGEIQVGKPATFKVTVRNQGTIAADGVVVQDLVPKGTQLIGTTPRASQGTRGELVWELGTLQPGEQSDVEMQLMPVAEGEIGSVATVRFAADASARTTATKPELLVKSSAQPQVLIGEKVALAIEVSNPGSGVATGVVLTEHIPAGLQHAAGSDLEYEIGDLKPGESRKLELEMVAARPGPVTNVLVLQGDCNLRSEDRLNLEVIAPQLAVAVEGPKRRYLEREAVYKLSVNNPGTAPAQRVELVAYLPSGLKFVSADNAGFYEEADQTVHWVLEELPTNETGTVGLVTMPVESGEQQIRLCGMTEKGLTAEDKQVVAVEGIAAILFEAVDVNDPIEVGGETTYEIRVLNQGSKAATNVRLVVTMPPQLQPVSAEGPAPHVLEANRVVFEGLARLAPKADTTYRVRAKGLQPGDLRAQVQLKTDEMASPVTKEESTRVYSDE